MNSSRQKKRHGYVYLRKDLRTCIIAYTDNGQQRFAKYHKVRDNYYCMNNFKQFVRNTFPTATHFNVYDATKEKRSNFVRQEKVTHW